MPRAHLRNGGEGSPWESAESTGLLRAFGHFRVGPSVSVSVPLRPVGPLAPLFHDVPLSPSQSPLPRPVCTQKCTRRREVTADAWPAPTRSIHLSRPLRTHPTDADTSSMSSYCWRSCSRPRQRFEPLGRSATPQLLPVDEIPPELHRLCRKRDRLSDSIMLFAAMTVEAFINFYGVYRLGEEQFKRHVERLPIERKMQLLLLICDGLEVDKGDRLIIALKAVAERRNAARTSEGKAGPTRPACERPHWMAHSETARSRFRR